MKKSRDQIVQEIKGVVQLGDVINFDSRAPGLISWIVYRAIRRVQKHKWGKNSRYRAIHSVCYIGDNKVISVEHPRGKIKPVYLGKRVRSVAVCRMKNGSHLIQHFHTKLVEAAMSLEGIRYDPGDLIDMLVRKLGAGWLPRKFKLFDLGRWRKVCSVAAHWCLLKWWKSERIPQGETGVVFKTPEQSGIPRPLGAQWVEDTCPADLENHSTFEVVYEAKT